MRVNESEGSAKWPLCIICLEKVRGVGDLVSYVRMIRDGVVKCNERDEELETWDELIRLRERLFWARMAGGVVPAFIQSQKSSPMVPESVQPGKSVRNNQGLKVDDITQPAGPDSPLAIMTRQDSGSSNGGNDTQDEIDQQLERALEEANASREAEAPSGIVHSERPTSAPLTPPQPPNRESGGFLKVNIPGSFWSNSQVNVLH